jgi:hypothetical protein
MDRRERIAQRPQWASTVGELLKAQARVTAFCSRCDGTWPKDEAWLRRLADERGADFSLWGLRPPCWTPGCSDRLFFRASVSEGTPSIRLEDRGLRKSQVGFRPDRRLRPG